MPRLLPLLLFPLLLVRSAPAAEPVPFLIVNPGGRGDQGLAAGFLADFGGALQASWPAGQGSPPAFTGRYHVSSADAVGSVKGSRPLVGQVSPSFYLREKARLPMTPLLVPVRAEGVQPVVHVVVRESDAAARSALAAGRVASRRVGGQLAAEPDWVTRVVLDGLAADAPLELVPFARPLEAARQLSGGQLDALLLPDADWRTLVASGKSGGLVVGWSSAPLPEGPFVAFAAASDAPRLSQARRAAAALLRFPETQAGRAVLSRMGLAAYREVTAEDHATFSRLETRLAPR